MRSGSRLVSRPSCSMLTRADRVALEERDRLADRRRVDLQRVWRLRQSLEAQGRIAGLVAVAIALGRIAIGHALGEAEGVPLRRRRLGDEFVPVMGIKREDPSIAHDERHSGGMEVIFEEFEGAAQVALPAVRVPGQDQVEGACLGPGQHLVHRWRAPDRRAALGDLEHESRVDEAVALDKAVLLLALAGRAVAVVLAGRRLADPAGDAQSPDVVERPRQSLHAAVSFFRGCIPVMVALPSRPSRPIWSGVGPSGRAPKHPSSSCTTDRAPRSWRC
jgi:hypothetical protein